MSDSDSTDLSSFGKQASLKIGDPFHRLRVVGPPTVETVATERRYCVYPCECECGNTLTVRYPALVTHNTKSCGCLQKDKVRARSVTHGMTDTRLYRIWSNMRTRCGNPNFPRYKDYGGRGITICDQWATDFVAFHNWANTNGYRDDLTIERVDVNGNYEPSNCTWIPQSAQRDNARDSIYLTVDGETKNASRWAEDPRCSVTAHAIRYRIKVLGWDDRKAVLTPSTSSR